MSSASPADTPADSCNKGAVGSASFVSESCDGRELHSFAKKTPAVRKSTDPHLFQKRTLQRGCQVKAIDALMKHPDMAFEAWSLIEDCMRKATSGAPPTDRWNDQYKKLGKLPTYWMASWMITKAGGRLTTEQLEDMTHKRGEAFIRECFWFVTQCGPADALPEKMLDKLICAKVFNQRHDGLGGRLHKLVQSGIFEGKDLSWTDVGPYTIEWDGQRAKSITHISGAVAAIEGGEAEFTTKFSIHCAHSDYDCYVKGRMAKYYLRQYFDESEGPFRTMLRPDTLLTLAEQTGSAIDKVKTDLCMDIVKDDPSVLPDQNLLKRQAALARARQMLANKKAKIQAGSPVVKAESSKSELQTPTKAKDELAPAMAAPVS